MFFKNKQDREDFFQYLRLKKVQGRNANISKIHIDWLRETYRRQKLIFYLLDDDKFKIEQLNPEDLCVFKHAFYKLADKLCLENRMVLFLKFIWGLTSREIADCFGCHETNIHYRINLIKKAARGL